MTTTETKGTPPRKTPRTTPRKRDSLTADERREKFQLRDIHERPTTTHPDKVPAWWNSPFPVLRYKTISDHYVWCDEHCEIHEAQVDAYQDGSEGCGPLNWRAVFIATDDAGEEF